LRTRLNLSHYFSIKEGHPIGVPFMRVRAFYPHDSSEGS
jgi:hypothetical protein